METAPQYSRDAYFRNIAAAARTVAVIALLLLGLSLCAHKIIDTDVWWHLRTGKYILETGTIPGADMYSYTAGGNTWIDLHWLFQTILYGTYSALGSYGLSLLIISVFSACFIVLWMACARRKNSLAIVFFFWLALMASSSRFLARPEAFTYLMIALYTLILLGYERGRWNRLVLMLIPLQALWANMQGLFILGPFLIFAHAVQPTCTVLVSRVRARDPQPEHVKKMKTLIIVLVGSLAACLANPYGFDGALFPFTLFTRAGGMENIFARSIAELQPPFSGYNLTLPLKYFGVYLALCAGVLALDFKNWRLSHILIFAGTGYLALSARRSVPVFVFAFLPLAVEHADSLIDGVRKLWDGRYGRWIERLQLSGCVILACVFILQIHSVVSNRHYSSEKRAERFGFGFKEQAFPDSAFAFIEENRIRGPFFNNMDIGGMFIWKMYPREKVFIDARLEVNSADMFSEYLPAMYNASAFSRLSDKYRFNAAILSHTSGDALYLIQVMSLSPDWALVYLDPLAAVFVRTVAENADIIRENRIDIVADPIRSITPRDTLNDDSPRLLRETLGRIAPASPADTEAHNRFNLGLVFLFMKQYQRAIEQFTAGLELMPSSTEAHYNLGLTYERMGRLESAMEWYKKAIELNPRHASSYGNLGRIYDARGLKKEAEECYRMAIKWGGDHPVSLYNLGALYYERGDHESARRYWQRALEVNPSFKPAQEALKKIP